MALDVFGTIELSGCGWGDTEAPEDFISDAPTGGIDDGDAKPGDGPLEISEGGIIEIDGDRLYALSAYAGLTVVDVSDPDALVSLGSWESDAEPFQMLVEAGQVLAMLNEFGSWQWDPAFETWDLATSSRLVALDATTPEQIEVEGELGLPGRIQDAHRVGDVLILVTLENGYCWGCDGESKTVITSLDISDMADPTILDQLAFPADGPGWDWQRSVTANGQRLYVAAHPGTWASWAGLGSIIDVVEITAGDGSLSAGTTIEIAGTVADPWQMNEHQGVLRVVSELGDDPPVLETFAVQSAHSVVPLGSATLSLSGPGSLRDARFDGPRAYAITDGRGDPLITIDLSDPHHPAQVGALEIPGWVRHVETRDDRVLALGFDPDHPQGGLNVSLFDVSALDQPILRRRVHFGSDWDRDGGRDGGRDGAGLAEAFTIIDDEQMILVPHAGWDRAREAECRGSYRSGVEIIDWLDDDLIVRGRASARGRVRRAFTHAQRIVAASEFELASFDHAQRDAPEHRDSLALAVHVDDRVELAQLGEVWVRVGRDWRTGDQRLEIVAAARPQVPEPIGVIDLGEPGDCEVRQVEGLFARDDHLVIVQSSRDLTSSIRVITVDLQDPRAPVVDDILVIPGERSDGVAKLAQIVTQSSWLAQHGEHLAMLVRDPRGLDQVQVVDLTDPRALTIAAILERPAGPTRGQLSVHAGTITSWHAEPLVDQPGKVRFYLDRLDLDPIAWATKINVPGVVVGYDQRAGRAFTIDFDMDQIERSAAACYRHPKHWSFAPYHDDDAAGLGTCTLIHRTLERLDIDGSQATRVQTLDIEAGAGLSQLFATDSRIYAKTNASWWDEANGVYHRDTKLVIADLVAQVTELHELDGEQLGDWWWILAVDGSRALTRSNEGHLGLLDAAVIDQPTIEITARPGWSDCQHPVFAGDEIYCPMGPYGLAVVE